MVAVSLREGEDAANPDEKSGLGVDVLPEGLEPDPARLGLGRFLHKIGAAIDPGLPVQLSLVRRT